MIDSGRATAVAGIALSALLLACGQVAPEGAAVGGAGEAADAVAGASVGVPPASGGASGSGGAAAAGGATASGEAPVDGGVDVSGRWGMFGFEDPVGVELRQRAGSLTGSGCGVGVPNASNARYCASDLSGTVSGNVVKFAFKSTAEILPGRYLAELVASADGQRMAGRFGIGTSVDEGLWVGWLPVPGDDFWLKEPDLHFSFGQLALHLATAEADDPRFDPNAVYTIDSRVDGISGDLGAFFLSEMRRGPNGEIEAGPVPPTVPEIPVYVSIAGSGEHYTSVTARLSNGHTFTFDVLPLL